MGILDSAEAAGQIPLDPKLLLHSVARLTKPGAAFDRESHARHKYHKIPRPAVFKKNKSRELRKLRKAEIWKSGTLDQQVEQMAQWFPNLPPGGSTKGLSNPCLEQFGDVDIWARSGSGSGGSGGGPHERSIEPQPYSECSGRFVSDSAKAAYLAPVPCPKSDIGTLKKLPGEVRNNIYRFAVVEVNKSASALIAMQPNTCAVGPCMHTKARHCVPAIISTCKQIRHESAPIFFNENTGITFDEGMVLQGCIGNWIRTIGPYVDHIRKFTFQFLRPIHNDDVFIQWATYSISFAVAKYSESGRFEISQSAANTLAFNPVRDEICICRLNYERSLMDKQWRRYGAPLAGLQDKFPEWWRGPLEGQKPLSKHLIEMVQDDGFLDFAFRVRRNKQHPSLLKKCGFCNEVTLRA